MSGGGADQEEVRGKESTAEDGGSLSAGTSTHSGPISIFSTEVRVCYAEKMHISVSRR